MSEEQNEVSQEQKHLESLKKRADLMGINYHPSIGLEALKRKLNERLGDEEAPAKPAAKANSPASKVRPATKAEIANYKRKKANLLHRVQITCMNPMKKDIQGEVFSVGNRIIGTIKKFISFGVPVHVPEIILNDLKTRKYVQHYTTTDYKGNKIKKARLVREFAIAELPPLTQDELKQLAVAQARTQDAA